MEREEEPTWFGQRIVSLEYEYERSTASNCIRFRTVTGYEGLIGDHDPRFAQFAKWIDKAMMATPRPRTDEDPAAAEVVARAQQMGRLPKHRKAEVSFWDKLRKWAGWG